MAILKFFLYFSNLTLLSSENEVPSYVRLNSLRIALRIMLRSEAMDFSLDPRGILPPSIHSALEHFKGLQLQFIAGHEYAHYYCGHLSDNNIVSIPIKNILWSGDTEAVVPVYNNSQLEELEADLNAIQSLEITESRKIELLDAAIIWFSALELYELASELISPQSSYSYRTHPPASHRAKNLIENIGVDNHFRGDKLVQLQESIAVFSNFIREDIAINMEDYERYGSVYLDVPDTDWRGKELIDRVDYY